MATLTANTRVCIGYPVLLSFAVPSVYPADAEYPLFDVVL